MDKLTSNRPISPKVVGILISVRYAVVIVGYLDDSFDGSQKSDKDCSKSKERSSL
jgi:hypothetical protein